MQAKRGGKDILFRESFDATLDFENWMIIRARSLSKG